jgi:CubicO group peptidase (beta-lactamase class C family)
MTPATDAAGAPDHAPVPVRGRVEPGWEPVRAVVEQLAAQGAETGAGVAVVHDGVAVVDLQVGWADRGRMRRWEPDTLVMVYSVSKPVTAVAALHALHRSGVDLDDLVTRWWPEYGQADKAGTTVRHLLAHQAGLPAFPPGTAAALTDRDALEAALAGAAPAWEPGRGHGEHAITYGFLVDGLVRRVTGLTLGTWVADLGQLIGQPDLLLGLGPKDARRAAALEAGEPGWAEAVLGPPGTAWHAALAVPPGVLDPNVMSSPRVRQAELGAIGLHASAFALAAWYADLLDERGRLAQVLGPDLHRAVLHPAITGPDEVFGLEATWGLGVPVELDRGTGRRAVGMAGVGGSLAEGIALRGSDGPHVGLAYVTRRLSAAPRADAVEAAVDEVLARG